MLPERLAPLVATKLRIAALLAIPILLVVGGVAIGALGMPAVAGMQNSFGDVDEETTVIETDLVINNPNPLGLSLQNLTVDYTVSMNGIEMADGDLDGIAIGSGNTSIDLESTLRNEAIGEWWTSHVGAGEVTDVDIDLTVTSERFNRSIDHTHRTTIETDILAEFNSDETREVNADSPLTDDPVLYINATRAEWGDVSDTETEIDMEFLVHNPNLEPYVITRMGYEITMNDVPVGSGETDREHIIASHSHEEIPLNTGIDATALDEWWVTHLDEDILGHQVSELRIEFHAIIELPTGEDVRVDLEPLTYEELITTDFFDEGGDVGEPDDAPPTDGDDRDEDAADDDAETDDEADTTDDDAGTDDEADADEEDPPADDDDGLLI